MLSTLIRYTSSKYAEDILKGDLYLSSLSTFWDLWKGKIPYEDIVSGKATEEDLRKAEASYKLNQQDFSEGVSAQAPYSVLKKILPPDLYQHIIHDARFRIEAYGYCNLLCFFRVDARIMTGAAYLDEENTALLAREKKIKGINSYQDFMNLPTQEQIKVAKLVAEPNSTLTSHLIPIVQLPNINMDGFGDLVIVVKDEEQFIQRILESVRRQGGECIIGDVRYHEMQDRINPKTMMQHHGTLLSKGLLSDMKELLGDSKDVISYGCLDKYERFADQKEWRVCWLPQKHNYEGKILRLGNISDIVDLVDSKDIRRYLLKKYSGYLPGIVLERRRHCKGTMSYKEFKEMIEGIDGKCEIMFEIG